jgi:hypothetical protein
VVDIGVDVRTLRADGTRLYGTGLPSQRSHRMDLAPIAFFALDISDPLRPRRVGLLDLPGTEPGRPALTPDYVAVPVGDAVHYLEMSQSGRPTLVRTLDAPAKDAVWVAGTLATALGDVGLGYISAPR